MRVMVRVRARVRGFRISILIVGRRLYAARHVAADCLDRIYTGNRSGTILVSWHEYNDAHGMLESGWLFATSDAKG